MIGTCIWFHYYSKPFRLHSLPRLETNCSTLHRLFWHTSACNKYVVFSFYTLNDVRYTTAIFHVDVCQRKRCRIEQFVSTAEGCEAETFWNKSEICECFQYVLRHEKTCLCHIWTTNAQISLRIRAVWSAPLLFTAWIISYLYLLNPEFQNSVAEQAGLSLTWSQTPKTDFLVTCII